MSKKTILVLIIFLSISSFSQDKLIEQKVENLLKQMTLEEKIGQLNQYTGDGGATGPITINPNNKQKLNKV